MIQCIILERYVKTVKIAVADFSAGCRFLRNFCSVPVFIVFIFISFFGFSANAEIITSKDYVDNLLATKVNTADLADIIASAITGKEDTSNKVASVSGGGTGITVSSTDTQYPSAKATWDGLVTKVGLTGNETVAGDKTFSGNIVVTGSLIVPTMPLP